MIKTYIIIEYKTSYKTLYSENGTSNANPKIELIEHGQEEDYNAARKFIKDLLEIRSDKRYGIIEEYKLIS